MSASNGLEYIEMIKPTFENAKAIQKLTLQDVEAGGFENPLELADPFNTDKVISQRQKLRDHPERYSGYVRDGRLVAYIKQNDWTITDELPFASRSRAVAIRASLGLHMSPSTGQWGVFGLVASNDLNDEEREMVLRELLRSSFVDPRTSEPRTVNIAIHERDPLFKIAVRLGFKAVGEIAEAAGAPGLMQQRYQRSASN